MGGTSETSGRSIEYSRRTIMLYAKMSKCEFVMKEMLYLGHIINEEGVQVDMEKI